MDRSSPPSSLSINTSFNSIGGDSANLHHAPPPASTTLQPCLASAPPSTTFADDPSILPNHRDQALMAAAPSAVVEAEKPLTAQMLSSQPPPAVGGLTPPFSSSVLNQQPWVLIGDASLQPSHHVAVAAGGNLIPLPPHATVLQKRLRLSEVFDVKRLQMRYGTSLIGGPSTLATFVAVYALFGPTFPGIYDKDRVVYTLFYPGLSFAFPIPSQYTECCHDGETELPLEFPDGTTLVTCRISINDKSTDMKVGVGSLMNKAIAPPLPAGSLYIEEQGLVVTNAGTCLLEFYCFSNFFMKGRGA